jgi:hypothetical protein
MSAISDLVEQFNAGEQEQNARLLQLFRLLAARKGWRVVKFQSWPGIWANCFDGIPRINEPRTLQPMDRTISEVVEGEEV